jgi:hypothetical protein
MPEQFEGTSVGKVRAKQKPRHLVFTWKWTNVLRKDVAGDSTCKQPIQCLIEVFYLISQLTIAKGTVVVNI